MFVLSAFYEQCSPENGTVHLRAICNWQFLQKEYGEYGERMLIGLEYGPVARTCEHTNKPASSTKLDDVLTR